MDEGVKKMEKVVVFYDSKTHGTRRYFQDDPAKNPAKDGKPLWTKNKNEAKRVTKAQVKQLAQWLTLCGYKGLKMQVWKNPFTLIQGGKLDEPHGEFAIPKAEPGPFKPKPHLMLVHGNMAVTATEKPTATTQEMVDKMFQALGGVGLNKESIKASEEEEPQK